MKLAAFIRCPLLSTTRLEKGERISVFVVVWPSWLATSCNVSDRHQDSFLSLCNPPVAKPLDWCTNKLFDSLSIGDYEDDDDDDDDYVQTGHAQMTICPS